MSDAESVKFEEVDVSDLPTPEAVGFVVERAAALRASDLFILSDGESTSIAIRRFGLVEQLTSVSPERGCQLISAIKVSADMDIAEKRRPLAVPARRKASRLAG